MSLVPSNGATPKKAVINRRVKAVKEGAITLHRSSDSVIVMQL